MGHGSWIAGQVPGAEYLSHSNNHGEVTKHKGGDIRLLRRWIKGDTPNQTIKVLENSSGFYPSQSNMKDLGSGPKSPNFPNLT